MYCPARLILPRCGIKSLYLSMIDFFILDGCRIKDFHKLGSQSRLMTSLAIFNFLERQGLGCYTSDLSPPSHGFSNLPRVRFIRATDDANQRGFFSAVAPEYAPFFARVDAQSGMVEHEFLRSTVVVRVDFTNIYQFNHGVKFS